MRGCFVGCGLVSFSFSLFFWFVLVFSILQVYVCAPLNAYSCGSVLHAWLAVPGLGDTEVMVLRNPFKEGDGLVDEGEGGEGDGGKCPGGGEKDLGEIYEKREDEK